MGGRRGLLKGGGKKKVAGRAERGKRLLWEGGGKGGFVGGRGRACWRVRVCWGEEEGVEKFVGKYGSFGVVVFSGKILRGFDEKGIF